MTFSEMQPHTSTDWKLNLSVGFVYFSSSLCIFLLQWHSERGGRALTVSITGAVSGANLHWRQRGANRKRNYMLNIYIFNVKMHVEVQVSF